MFLFSLNCLSLRVILKKVVIVVTLTCGQTKGKPSFPFLQFKVLLLHMAFIKLHSLFRWGLTLSQMGCWNLVTILWLFLLHSVNLVNGINWILIVAAVRYFQVGPLLVVRYNLLYFLLDSWFLSEDLSLHVCSWGVLNSIFNCFSTFDTRIMWVSWDKLKSNSWFF